MTWGKGGHFEGRGEIKGPVKAYYEGSGSQEANWIRGFAQLSKRRKRKPKRRMTKGSTFSGVTTANYKVTIVEVRQGVKAGECGAMKRSAI